MGGTAAKQMQISGDHSDQDSRPILTAERNGYVGDCEPDWASAAPSWSALVTGIVLPALGALAVVLFIDFLLCSLLQQAIGDLSGVSVWFAALSMLPVTLGTIALARLLAARFWAGFRSRVNAGMLIHRDGGKAPDFH